MLVFIHFYRNMNSNNNEKRRRNRELIKCGKGKAT